MTFTLADTRARYRSTLEAMQQERVGRLGDDWDKAALSFYFGPDEGLADASVRDTLDSMLDEDNRTLEGDPLLKLLDFAIPDQLAGAVARQIHRAYLSSKPKPAKQTEAK